MILSLISPSGERWIIDPAPSPGRAWAEWLVTLDGLDHDAASEPLMILLGQRIFPPKGKAVVAQTKRGWQAILSNP